MGAVATALVVVSARGPVASARLDIQTRATASQSYSVTPFSYSAKTKAEPLPGPQVQKLARLLRIAFDRDLLEKIGAAAYVQEVRPQVVDFLTGTTNALPEVRQAQRSFPEADRQTLLVGLRKMYEERPEALRSILTQAHYRDGKFEEHHKHHDGGAKLLRCNCLKRCACGSKLHATASTKTQRLGGKRINEARANFWAQLRPSRKGDLEEPGDANCISDGLKSVNSGPKNDATPSAPGLVCESARLGHDAFIQSLASGLVTGDTAKDIPEIQEASFDELVDVARVARRSAVASDMDIDRGALASASPGAAFPLGLGQGLRKDNNNPRATRSWARKPKALQEEPEKTKRDDMRKTVDPKDERALSRLEAMHAGNASDVDPRHTVLNAFKLVSTLAALPALAEEYDFAERLAHLVALAQNGVFKKTTPAKRPARKRGKW
eukprot:g4061.t1